MATAKSRPKAKGAAKKGAKRRGTAARRIDLLLGTRKGAFTVRGDGTRRAWKLAGPHFLGNETNHMVLDPRDRKTLLVAAKTGHLGPTVFRSTDNGKNWKEAIRPPAFPKAPEGEKGLAVDRVFFLAPGHASQPNVWWAGTVPHGLFKSVDGGVTWDLMPGLSDYLQRLAAAKEGYINETPGGKMTHSILVDPRDAAHMFVGISTGGVFESTDGARSWRPLNEGSVADFIPEKTPEYGQDPHCVVMHPLEPDRLYQQNHCGVYRLDRPEGRWDRIGKNLPPKIGDIGFPIVTHPRDPDTVWVFPMDGTEVWPRTCPEGKPAAFRSSNAGRTWTRQTKGFPAGQGWFTVFRQAMKSDRQDPVGLYLGTTAGEIWASRDEGASWRPIAQHLPAVLSLEVVER